MRLKKGDTSIFTFKKLLGHEGSLTSKSEKYKGSLFNVLVQWEDETKTWELLSVIATDDPITCAEYASDNNLLNTLGWKRLRKFARNKKLDRMVKQATIRRIPCDPI